MTARSILVRGVVQGVGFRPFVFRLARANELSGWVRNQAHGVAIHLEGAEAALDHFMQDLIGQAPPAASIANVEITSAEPAGLHEFQIQGSERQTHPSARISPDLPVCEDCLRELFDPADPRFGYPYINCTNCGPRYSIIQALPYDRANTVMRSWTLDARCAREYADPGNRRFHAQPVACPGCGPRFPGIEEAAKRLSKGGIVAVKGIGGYHLACDARNPAAVRLLRERKYRKERPFALMASCIGRARELAELSPASQELLLSSARPIVLATAKVELPGVAPDNAELGVLLPYTPLHHLLFAAGAPDPLVMTSANRSSEPIAYTDADALERLNGIADFFLIGERPIVRRVEDSVARAGVFGPVILRRSRGYAPSVVSRLPCTKPILALGADLKNAIALAVEGEVVVSQHIGDLENYAAREAFRTTIADLLRMYEVQCDELTVVHDSHPQYASTQFAMEFPCAARISVQHHRAHIASVVAEREAWDRRVLGVAFDGTGYGDDGNIWGGEIFAGSAREGFIRAGHLRRASLAGGDAAAAHPVQAAAGFLAQLDRVPDLQFPPRYEHALQLVQRGIRTFTTTSVGRLFDAAAAVLGFTRPVSFEGQAAIWLEQLAKRSGPVEALPFPFVDDELDFRSLLGAVIDQKVSGHPPVAIARAFHAGLAQGLAAALGVLRQHHPSDTVVLSGGVFQNELLLTCLRDLLANHRLEIWTNRAVPPNDGGICLGQAALAAMEIGCDA